MQFEPSPVYTCLNHCLFHALAMKKVPRRSFHSMRSCYVLRASKPLDLDFVYQYRIIYLPSLSNTVIASHRNLTVHDRFYVRSRGKADIVGRFCNRELKGAKPKEVCATYLFGHFIFQLPRSYHWDQSSAQRLTSSSGPGTSLWRRAECPPSPTTPSRPPPRN